MCEATFGTVCLVAARLDVLKLNVVLIKVLDNTNVVVLDVALILSGHGVVRHLRAVKASRISLNHVVEHLIIQILGVSYLGIVLLSDVDTVVERLQAHSG